MNDKPPEFSSPPTLSPEDSKRITEEGKELRRQLREKLATKPLATYCCQRCRTRFNYHDQGPTWCCIWGRCNGTAYRIGG